MKNKSELIHDENLNIGKVRLINFLSFLYGFSSAISAYIISFYFQLASGREEIGIFYFISYGIILVLFLNLHKIIRKIGKSYFLIWTLLIKTAMAALLIFVAPSLTGALFVVIYIIFSALSWVGFDIALESFSEDKMSGRIRGLYLTVANAGVLLGPLLSTQILDKYGFAGIFFITLLFDFFIYALAFKKLRNINHDFERRLTVIEILKNIGKRKDIMRTYYISFILDFFYAGMIVYTPLYLKSLGMSLEEIGVIFTIMLLPFVLFQYPAGFLADKKIGEKELLIFAIFIMGVSTGFIYFIDSTSIAVWATALFITRIGAALIEILRDSYFYKRIDGHDVDAINFFRTTRPVAYLLFTLISGGLIILFSFKIFFLLIAFITLAGLYPAFRLVDNRSECELDSLAIKKQSQA